MKKFHWGRGNEGEFNLEVICLPRDPRWSQMTTAPVPMVKLTSVSQLLVPAFNGGSDALDLIWFKHIEQKGKRRGNQTPLGILFESTKKAGLKPAEDL